MVNSYTLYLEACNIVKNFPDEYWRKNFYLRIVTTMFYELLKDKTSPLISKFCADNEINFQAKNFTIAPFQKNYAAPKPISCDAYMLTFGLSVAFNESLDACDKYYEEQAFKNFIFFGKILPETYAQEIMNCLATADNCMKNFQPVEKVIQVPVEKVVEKIIETPVENVTDPATKMLLDELDGIAKNRVTDDAKITDEVKQLQISLQNELALIQQSLKQISEIRDGVEYRDLKEPIYQLIQLHRKVFDSVKRHPMDDREKGYTTLIKRFNSVLTYVTQSLKMLGVELIDGTGGVFDPVKNKVADDADNPLDCVVKKIIRPGFMYKGTVLEQAEVEVEKKTGGLSGIIVSARSNFFGR